MNSGNVRLRSLVIGALFVVGCQGRQGPPGPPGPGYNPDNSVDMAPAGGGGGGGGGGGDATLVLDNQPSYNFGDIVVDGESAPRAFTLRNDGAAATGVVGDATLSAAGFRVVSDGCTGKTLAPTDSCKVTVA